MPEAADLFLHNGKITTLDRSNPAASAVAIRNGVFTAVGRDEDIMPLADPSSRVIDLKGRRVLPGLRSTAPTTVSDARPRSGCGFRFNPAGCSDVKPAGIPI